MPRNITVTFNDGSTHVYANAPDNVTPEAVTARAAKDFGKTVKSLDGGRGAPTARPQNRQVLTVRQRPETEDQRIARVARQTVSADHTGGFGGAFVAGVGRSLFGIPERLAAAGERWLPSAITGNTTNASYDQILKAVRARSDARMAEDTGGNIIGQITGAVTGGGAAGAGVRAIGGRLAATGLPGVARAGNVLQGLATVRKGQTARNASKIVLAGGAAGGAQAAGEGSDVGTGVAGGAIGAAALGGAVKVGSKLVRNLAKPYSGNVGRAVREIVTESPDAIAARHADLERRTGGPVPLIAALNDRDVRAVSEKVLKRSQDAVTIAKGASTQHVRRFMDRMLGHVNSAGREGDAQITSIGELSQLRRDTADELMHPIGERQIDMTQIPLGDVERSVARQVGGRTQGLAARANQAFRDLTPDDLDGLGLDASDLANARRLMTQYGFGTPVHATVRELDGLRRALEKAGKNSDQSNPINALAFRNAAKAIGAHVSGEVPQYGQMLDTYAAQSRMMEGFETASKGTRVPDVADDLLRSNLRTTEGRVGMKAGELFRLRSAATAKPTSAIALARNAGAEGELTRPASMEPGAAQPGSVTENLGERPAANLADASRAETSVLSRMLDTDKVQAAAKEDGALDAESLVAAAFLGPALVETKVRFGLNLYRALRPKGISEKVANNIAERLYSQDPAQTQAAFNALRRSGLGERAIDGLIRRSASIAGNPAGGAAAAPAAAPVDYQPAPGQPPLDQTELEQLAAQADADASAAPAAPADPQQPAAPVDASTSPYAPALQSIYDNESPEMLALIDRVEHQESGGNQGAVSKAGAVGVMQVMPDTAPEAARLADVPFDENAYRTDPAYNKLLGIAYLSMLLNKYDGDVAKATAAYNAGHGRVDQEVSGGGNWFGRLPAETQDYVKKVAA